MYDSENPQAYVEAQLATNYSADYPTFESTYARTMACKCECTKYEKFVMTDFVCPRGFTANHINILSIIKDNRLPLSFKHISEQLLLYFETELSQGAVRGIIERLKRNKLITSKLSRLVNRRGNLYTFTHLVCEHIPKLDTYLYTNTETKVRYSIKDRIDRNTSNLSIKQESVSHKTEKEAFHQTFKEVHNLAMQKDVNRQFSAQITTEQKLYEKLMNLSDKDIAFFWPNLHKNSFGRLQIEQIVHRLKQQGIELDQVMQGLTHAEWDLAHNQMKDKNGEHVKSPTSWTFQILARQGYYPRPSNYMSPDERAESDKKAEREALEKIKKENEEHEFQMWLSTFSIEEQKEIVEEERGIANTDLTFPPRHWFNIRFKKIKSS